VRTYVPPERVYLERFPPHLGQFHKTRVQRVTGCIVVHDAENIIDLQGEDTGGEGVASFIQNRTDFGSYHDVADFDSRIQLGRYGWTMFHCVGANSWTTSVSFACRTGDFRTMPPERLAGFMRHGAEAVADQIEWYATQGIQVPLRRLTAAEAKAGKPGFVDHARMDPGRRSDPGQWFPWEGFFQAIKVELERRDNGDDEDMAKTWSLNDLGATLDNVGAFYARDVQRTHREAGREATAEMVADAVRLGRNGWHDEVVKTLKAGTDPIKLLEFVEWALANPEAAKKL